MADANLPPVVAWRREWDGDESDANSFIYAEDEADTHDGCDWWTPLVTLADARACIMAFAEQTARECEAKQKQPHGWNSFSYTNAVNDCVAAIRRLANDWTEGA